MQRRGVAGPHASIVVYLRKEIAPAFWRHVEEAPERVDKIAGRDGAVSEREGQSSFLGPRSD